MFFVDKEFEEYVKRLLMTDGEITEQMLEGIEILNLRAKKYSDLSPLAKMISLSNLTFSGFFSGEGIIETNLNKETVKLLENLPSLCSVTVSNPSKEEISCLSVLPHLTILNLLYSCDVKPVFPDMSKFKTLQTLSIHNASSFEMECAPLTNIPNLVNFYAFGPGDNYSLVDNVYKNQIINYI